MDPKRGDFLCHSNVVIYDWFLQQGTKGTTFSLMTLLQHLLPAGNGLMNKEGEEGGDVLVGGRGKKGKLKG